MVFVTLELNEKMKYIHIQRGKPGKGYCSRLHVFLVENRRTPQCFIGSFRHML